MAYDQLIRTYLGVGLLADRPATANVKVGVGAFYYATDTAALYVWDGATWQTLASGSLTGMSEPYVCLQEQQPSGTNGGTFTSGAWQTRALNTVVCDTGSNVVSLTSGEFVLAAGTYRMHARAPGHMVNRHQARLQNVTAGVTLLTGTCSRAMQTESAQTDSVILGRFAVAAGQSLALQHQCSVTQTTDGFGNAAAFDAEVFSQVVLWKE